MLFANVDTADRIRLAIVMPYKVVERLWYLAREQGMPIVREIDNWWEVPLIYIGAKKSSKIRFRNGRLEDVDRASVHRLFVETQIVNISDDAKRKYCIKELPNGKVQLKIKGKTLVVDLDVVKPLVRELDYEKPKVPTAGKDVVDIGAYTGDTPIYYLFNGKARHVYALEFNYQLYRKGLKTIRSNHLDNKITFMNVAASATSGTMKVGTDETNFQDTKKGAQKMTIRKMTIDDMVREFGLKDAVLKMDCEGCEYDLIRSVSSKALRSFSGIYIEYHYGYWDLAARLRKEGFEVRYTSPVYGLTGIISPGKIMGDLVAIRK